MAADQKQKPLQLRRKSGGTVTPPQTDHAVPQGQQMPPDMMPVELVMTFRVDGAPILNLKTDVIIARPGAEQGTSLNLRLDARQLVAQLAAACGYVPEAAATAPQSKIWTPRD